MKEFITANNITYECTNVETTAASIAFTTDAESADQMAEEFKDVTSLTVSDADGNVYGRYDNIRFDHASINADGAVIVTMHIKSALEVRLDRLEDGQDIQDGAIKELAEIIGG